MVCPSSTSAERRPRGHDGRNSIDKTPSDSMRRPKWLPHGHPLHPAFGWLCWTTSVRFEVEDVGFGSRTLECAIAEWFIMPKRCSFVDEISANLGVKLDTIYEWITRSGSSAPKPRCILPLLPMEAGCVCAASASSTFPCDALRPTSTLITPRSPFQPPRGARPCHPIQRLRLVPRGRRRAPTPERSEIECQRQHVLKPVRGSEF